MTTLQATTTYPALVGRLISESRRARNLKQEQLAEFVGVNQPAWSKIERGESVLTIEQLAMIAPALGQTPGSLLAQADRAVKHAQEQGVRVEWRRVPPTGSNTMALLGAAALGAIIGAILMASAVGTARNAEAERDG